MSGVGEIINYYYILEAITIDLGRFPRICDFTQHLIVTCPNTTGVRSLHYNPSQG